VKKIKIILLLAILFVVFTFLHNLIYHLTKIEEPVFVILAISSLLLVPVYVIHQFTKNIIFSIAFFLVFALDWAALHDIIVGTEPTLWEEYLVLILSAPALFILSFLSIKNKRVQGARS